MTELTRRERAVVEASYEWVDDHEAELVDLLEELVARPSVTGDEGTHDDPGTTVGHLYRYLSGRTEAAALDVQPLPSEAEPDYVDTPRENLYAVLDGAGDGGFVGLTHTDVVPADTPSAWPGDDPFTVSHGTVRRLDRRTIELTVDGERHERTIRENLATVWDQRDGEAFDALVGRGVYDNKVNSVLLAGSLLALEASLADEGATLGGDLIHGHLVDEEKAQKGIKNMVGWDDGDPNADWLGDRYDDYDGFGAVTLEGQYGFVPVVGHRGGINLTITARGDAVHGSTPHLGRNAVLGMAKLLAHMDTGAFDTAITEPFVDDELLGELTVAPGTTIASNGVDGVTEAGVQRSGGAEYAVADYCQATVDCRIPRWEGFPEGFEAVLERVLEIVHEAATAVAPEVDFEVEPNMIFLPVAMGADRADAADHPLVAAATATTEEVCGYAPEIAVAPGATDSWVMYHGTGIPTLVEYGPAGALSHEPLEYVERDQVAAGAKALCNLAVRQLGVE